MLAAISAAPPCSAAAPGPAAYPVGYGTAPLDPRIDPWIPVTDAMVAPLLTPKQRRTRRAHSVVVDYDGDGLADEAWMVANSRQIGVLVRLGGSRRILLAFRADGRWSDQSLVRIGASSIGVDFPESTIVVLFEDGGRPMVHYPDEGGG